MGAWFVKNMSIVHELVPCIRCHIKFRRIDNLGTWQCALHPGSVAPVTTFDETEGQYTCCGASRDGDALTGVPVRRDPQRVSSGCVPCDHASGPEEVYARSVQLNVHDWQYYAEHARLPLRGSLPPRDGQTVTIVRRQDWMPSAGAKVG